MTSTARRIGLCRWLLLIAGLHAAILVALAIEPSSPPPPGGLLEAMWVNGRRPLAMAWVAWLVLAPPLSLGLWVWRPASRFWLVLVWIGFGLVAWMRFGNVIAALTRVLWTHVT